MVLWETSWRMYSCVYWCFRFVILKFVHMWFWLFEPMQLAMFPVLLKFPSSRGFERLGGRTSLCVNGNRFLYSRNKKCFRDLNFYTWNFKRLVGKSNDWISYESCKMHIRSKHCSGTIRSCIFRVSIFWAIFSSPCCYTVTNRHKREKENFYYQMKVLLVYWNTERTVFWDWFEWIDLDR